MGLEPTTAWTTNAAPNVLSAPGSSLIPGAEPLYEASTRTVRLTPFPADSRPFVGHPTSDPAPFRDPPHRTGIALRDTHEKHARRRADIAWPPRPHFAKTPTPILGNERMATPGLTARRSPKIACSAPSLPRQAARQLGARRAIGSTATRSPASRATRYRNFGKAGADSIRLV